MIETKWVYKNKMDESGKTGSRPLRIRGSWLWWNFCTSWKARIFQILLFYTIYKGSKLFQINVKSVFKGFIDKKKFKTTPGFKNSNLPCRMFKFSEALYGLIQDPRAWHDRLRNFLIEHDLLEGKTDIIKLLL